MHDDTTTTATTTPAVQLTGRISEALAFAVEAHGSQTRKTTAVPYVAHVIGVASLVLEMGGDETEAVAAILHDTIEDSHWSDIRERLAASFEPEVVDLVEGVSETEGEWEQRKESYLAHLEGVSRGKLRIALADKLYNARATWRVPADVRWDRFNRGIDKQRWWYGALADRFEQLAADDPELGPFVAELRSVVDELFA